MDPLDKLGELYDKLSVLDENAALKYRTNKEMREVTAISETMASTLNNINIVCKNLEGFNNDYDIPNKNDHLVVGHGTAKDLVECKRNIDALFGIADDVEYTDDLDCSKGIDKLQQLLMILKTDIAKHKKFLNKFIETRKTLTKEEELQNTKEESSTFSFGVTSLNNSNVVTSSPINSHN